MGTLRDCFDRYGCDKGTTKHMYDRCYEIYMEDRKDDQLNILEIGCFRGESIEAWLDYFPHATIYTVDIFSRTDPDELEVLKNERVKWLKYDSTNAGLPMKMQYHWGNDIKFDFIIDDGAHWPQANRKTFEHCFPFLNQDGVYFIEDVWMLDRSEKANHDWVRKNPDRYVYGEHVRLMSEVEKYDLKHYDFSGTVRTNKVGGFKESYPDSWIMRIKHA